MLTVKCSGCKTKLWKYEKIGQGEVLRCHKKRMSQVYVMNIKDGKVYCDCGKEIGIDKGAFIKMIAKAFTYSGTKQNK